MYVIEKKGYLNIFFVFFPPFSYWLNIAWDKNIIKITSILEAIVKIQPQSQITICLISYYSSVISLLHNLISVIAYPLIALLHLAPSLCI